MESDNYKEHLLFDKIQQLEEIFNNSDSAVKVDFENLTYFKSVYDYISQRLKLTIPDLVQHSEMDALSNEIAGAVTQINNFLGNNNSGHLTNAKNNLNSALNRIRNFPIPVSKTDFNFSKKISNFESIAKKKYESLEKENQKLEKQLNEFNQDLKNKKNEIERLLKLVENKESQIQSLNSNFQTEFDNIKAKHNQIFESDKKTYRDEIDSDKTVFRKEIDELKDSIDTDTTGLVEKLEQKLKEAEKLVNVIGNVGVTGNYQIIANEHKSTANFWRGVAIAFMAVFSGLLVWTIFDLSSDGFDWTKSLIRLVAAAALSYPATYAARESSKHRKLETVNRTAELELASINPFIEILDESKKQTIKEKLVEKYFGNDKSNILDSEKSEEGLSISAFEKLISSISKLKN